MSRLRAVVDWLERVTGGPEIVAYEVRKRYDDPRASGFVDWPERAVLMGREGTDCHIADHRDALRHLGQMIIDQEQLQSEYNHLWELHRQIVAERDTWRTRALAAEAKLRHPATGQQAA